MATLVVKNFKAADGKFEALGTFLEKYWAIPVLSRDA